MTSLSLPARPIVHVGYHKTATTWFQQHVWPSATSHDWVPRATVQEAFLAPPGMHFDPDASASILARDSRTRPLVLSEENLSGYIHNGGLHGLIGPEMARRIKAVLPDALIVVFVRNQREIVRAAYAQYVSGGGTFGLARYLDSHEALRGALTRPYKAPAFEWEHFEFDRLIAYYDTLFGRENVHVYPYEALRDRAALLRNMRRDLGIALPLGAAQDDSAANRSLGAGALLALRFANLFTRQSVVNKTYWIDLPGGQVLRHAVKRALGLLPAGRFVLPEATLQRIDQYYAESNRRLLRLRDLPLEELGYPLAPALPQAATTGDLRTAA